jgi:hypothetical protein
MMEFGHAAFIGLCVGLIWGIGCSLVLLYSIYLAGYRQAVKDSMMPEHSVRFAKTLEVLQGRSATRASKQE